LKLALGSGRVRYSVVGASALQNTLLRLPTIPAFRRPATMLSVLAAIIAAGPLVLCAPAPIQDWPSHLSRVHILAQMLSGPSAWHRFYEVKTFFLPNVVLDAVLLGFLNLGLPLNLAAVAFLLLTYALFLLGFCAIAATQQAFDASKVLLACVLFFNTSLFWGFLNFQFGLALLLLLIAFWLHLETRRPLRFAVAMIGAVTVFFCHLVAAVAFVVLLASIEFAQFIRAPSWRTLPLNTTGAAGAAVIVALLLASPTSHDSLTSMIFVNAGSIAGIVEWKLSLLPKAVMGAGFWADMATAGSVTLAVLGSFFVARIRPNHIAIAAILAGTALYIAAPTAIGRGALLDHRLAVLPLIFAAALSRFDWRSRGAYLTAVAFLAGIVSVRSVLILRDWRQAEAVVQGYAMEAASLPPGSTIMTALGRHEVPWFRLWSPPIMQIASRAALDNMFVPTVFADPTQQPLVILPAWRRWEDPLDLTSDSTAAQSIPALRELCSRLEGDGGTGRVYVLLLYPTELTERLTAAAKVIWRQQNMQLLEGCGIANSPMASRVRAD
jgi:hypothetical protein